MTRGHWLKRLADEQGLTFLLAFLFVLLFVVYPFFSLGRLGRYLVDGFLSLVLLSSAFSVEKPRLRRLAVWLAVATVVCRLLLDLLPSTMTSQAALVATIAFLWVAIGLLLARTFAEGRVTVRRIEGAVAVYLLIGLAFALTYTFIELSAPGAFALGREGAQEGMARFSYYSFITLTTVGYGDVTPVSTAAQTLSVLEGLVGQLYPAILLARLVSLELADSRAGREDRDPD